MSDTSELATINCHYCLEPLSYPSQSAVIRCPRCNNTMHPTAPEIDYVNCAGCSTVLSRSPSAMTIQCPKCLVIMELPLSAAETKRLPQQQQQQQVDEPLLQHSPQQPTLSDSTINGKSDGNNDAQQSSSNTPADDDGDESTIATADVKRRKRRNDPKPPPPTAAPAAESRTQTPSSLPERTVAEVLVDELLKPGTGEATMFVVNTLVICGMLALIALLFVGYRSIHIYALLAICTGLLISLQYYFAQTRTTTNHKYK